MEIRVTFPSDGNEVEIETISTLEDIWHDFEYFKSEAVRIQHHTATATDQFATKRYLRVALLMLVFYLEGVLNHWLKRLLSDKEWLSMERKCLELKIDAVQKRVAAKHGPIPNITEAKQIRHAIAHIKPGGDLDLYDKITQQLLDSTQASIVAWLDSMEARHGMRRHPDTKAESSELQEALGTIKPGTEGYSGTKNK